MQSQNTSQDKHNSFVTFITIIYRLKVCNKELYQGEKRLCFKAPIKGFKLVSWAIWTSASWISVNTDFWSTSRIEWPLARNGLGFVCISRCLMQLYDSYSVFFSVTRNSGIMPSFCTASGNTWKRVEKRSFL